VTNHEQAKWYLENVESLSYEQMAEALSYKFFRLCSLYYIKDKNGKKVRFTPNLEQEDFYLNQHGRDIILKARQLGFTTFKMVSDLDDCLFIKDHSAGCICHNDKSAKDIYRNKVKYAYKNIPESAIELLADVGYELPSPVNDKDNSYVFSNGSSIQVSTGFRGGTLQSLHISEFGSICKKYPDKAQEIVTGAFEAVAVGGTITVESTAEGRQGYFYDYCVEAQRLKKMLAKLSVLDFKFHFYSWYLRDEYEIDGRISPHLEKYFNELDGKYGIQLSDRKKAWYSAKEKVQGEKMKQEYPTTPEEAFEQSIEGAYYANQFAKIYKDGRICESLENKVKVNTVWDIGVGDSTAIWFYQKVGTEVHVIDFYENSGEGLQHYMKVLHDKNYDYGLHYGPHDIENREFGSNAKSRKQLAAEGFEINGKQYSIYFQVVAKKSIDAGIEDSRRMLDLCVFDKDKCEAGIKCLEAYRKEWNDKLGCWRDRPLHDWSSHAADAFRYLAVTEVGKAVQIASPRFG
jgi:hypothetical protein